MIQSHRGITISIFSLEGLKLSLTEAKQRGFCRILDKMKNNLHYTIHLDGALTGFVMPILKPFGDIENYFSGLGEEMEAKRKENYELN